MAVTSMLRRLTRLACVPLLLVIVSDPGVGYAQLGPDSLTDSGTKPLQRLGLGMLIGAAYSQDERFIATYGAAGAFLRDAETGEVIREFIGHTYVVSSLAFSPDGTRVLTGSWDTTAKLWDVKTGAELRTFSPGYHEVYSVAFSPDGARMLLGSSAETAKMWDLQTGAELRTFSGHSRSTESVAFSPDGAQVLTGSYDQTAKLWDAQTGAELLTFSGHTNQVSSVAFSPDGARVLTGSYDGTAKLWDAQTGAELRTFSGHTNLVTSVAFSPDGTQVLTGSWDNTAKLWDAQSGAELWTVGGYTGGIQSVAFSPDGARVLTAGDTAKLWDAQTGVELRTFLGHTEPVPSAAFSPDGARVLTGSGDTAKLWDAWTGTELRTFSGHANWVTSVVFSPDGARVLTGSHDKTAKLWDSQAGTELRTFSGHEERVSSVAFSPDGTRALTGSDDETAKLWDTQTGAVLRTFSTLPTGLSAFSPDATRVLTGAWDNTAKLWDAQTGAELRTFSGHANLVSSVAFSPDGPQMLTGSMDYKAKLWDAQTGVELRTFSGHTYVVSSVAFSPDGARVLTASGYDPIKLWDAQTGAELRTFSGHTDLVSSVAFSAEGTRILSGSNDGTTRLWELRPPRAVIVAGGGAYAGNSIARQTSDLGAYAYRTLRARGYEPDEIQYLSAFPDGTALNDGLPPVAWDLDGDGVDEVDAYASLEAVEDALAGPGAQEAGRLLVIMINHGYVTSDFMVFRVNPTQVISTDRVNTLLNDLQSNHPVDVTLVVDCCYSGHFVEDCRKTEAIPAERDRIVIASTSKTAEAVFLPAPDLTSFLHTFLGSAYMGNSMGEAWRSGQRFFSRFPVANQRPVIDDGEVSTDDDATTTTRANREFFGASWAYGVQADKNINRFFPAFDTVEPQGTVGTEQSVILRATLLPYQRPNSVYAAIRPPAPTVVSGEPITGLPRVQLTRVSDDFVSGEVWEADATDLFDAEGPYTISFTAAFEANRLSDPAVTDITVTDGPDPDPAAIRAIIAIGEGSTPQLAAAFADAGSFAWKVYSNRFVELMPNGTLEYRTGWIAFRSPYALQFADKEQLRRSEAFALKAYAMAGEGAGPTPVGVGMTADSSSTIGAGDASETQSESQARLGTPSTGVGQPPSAAKLVAAAPTASEILSLIDNQDAGTERLFVHLVAESANGGMLQLSGTESLSAADLDARLDAFQARPEAPEVVLIVDAAGSGSFLPVCAATGEQRRVVMTSGRAGDGALFLTEPSVSFTHKLCAAAWGGNDLWRAWDSTRSFYTRFLNAYSTSTNRIRPQCDSDGDGSTVEFLDNALPSTIHLGRRFAFAGDEASGLPFLLSGTESATAAPGAPVTVSLHLLEGIDPAADGVYVQLVPPGLDLTGALTTLDRVPLVRTGPDSWTWSATFDAPAVEGDHTLVFQAEYADLGDVKLAEPLFGTLTVRSNNGLPGDVNGDGSLTPADADLAFRCWLEAACPPGADALLADYCADGAVTPQDAEGIFGAWLGIGSGCP